MNKILTNGLRKIHQRGGETEGGQSVHDSTRNTSRRAHPALAMIFAALAGSAFGAAPINVPLKPANWTTKGDVKFQKIEGFPNGLMENKGGVRR